MTEFGQLLFSNYFRSQFVSIGSKVSFQRSHSLVIVGQRLSNIRSIMSSIMPLGNSDNRNNMMPPPKRARKGRKHRRFYCFGCDNIYDRRMLRFKCDECRHKWCKDCVPFTYIVPTCVKCGITYCEECEITSSCGDCGSYVCDSCHLAYQEKHPDSDKHPCCGSGSGSDDDTVEYAIEEDN